jgi:pilus assembly protein CpaF
MIGMTGFELPTRSMRAQIASALHVVIQLERMSDGRRRLISLQEITGMEGEVVSMQEIFRFRRESTDAEGRIHGHYVTTGIRPKFVSEFQARNIHVPEGIFDPNSVLD